ncbi:unnamed protein product [Pylaiella littoralis]
MRGYYGTNIRTLLSPNEQEIFFQRIESENEDRPRAQPESCAVSQEDVAAMPTADEPDLTQESCVSCAVVPELTAGDGAQFAVESPTAEVQRSTAVVVESQLREPVAQQSFVPVQPDSSSEDCSEAGIDNSIDGSSDDRSEDRSEDRSDECSGDSSGDRSEGSGEGSSSNGSIYKGSDVTWRGAPTHPFDPVQSPSRSSSSSSDDGGGYSSDTGMDATCRGEPTSPFDRNVEKGELVLGVAHPFDRGKTFVCPARKLMDFALKGRPFGSSSNNNNKPSARV